MVDTCVKQEAAEADCPRYKIYGPEVRFIPILTGKIKFLMCASSTKGEKLHFE